MTNPLPALDATMVDCPFPAYQAMHENASPAEIAPGTFLITFSSRQPTSRFEWFGPAQDRGDGGESLSVQHATQPAGAVC